MSANRRLFMEIIFDAAPPGGRVVEISYQRGECTYDITWMLHPDGRWGLRIPAIGSSDLPHPPVTPRRLDANQLRAVDAALIALASAPLSMLRWELEDCLQLLRSAHQAIAQGSITPALYRSLCDATGDHPNEDVIRLLDERA